MRKQKNLTAKILLIASLVTLLAINSRTIANPLRAKFLDISVIPLKALKGLGESVGSVLPFAQFRDENRLLRQRVDLLNRKLEESRMLQAENQRLKEILGFKEAIPHASVPSEVIGRDPTNWSNSLIIDKGAAQGVRQGRAVISMKGLVGRVLEVGKYSSKILLITDPNSKVGTVIQRNRQGGILVGRPDGKCKMIYIALDSDVSNGDKVITAGFGTIFPKGILIGEVIEVGKEPGRLYKYAIVRPSQDMSKLEEVLCLK